MATGANIRCPACRGAMVPAALRCEGCDLTVTGTFVSNEFASLGEEELHFLRIFVHCEGRIREMESALGVSYPTIKNRLAKLKEVLGASAGVVPAAGERRESSAEILGELEAGRISFEEAKDRLKARERGRRTMKDHILKILQMQEEGKLSREQAAELLAALADGAREKNEQYNTGVPRPEGVGFASGGSPGSGAFREFVDKVTEMGTKVGHSATVWGGELMNTVHRDEGGNSVTLSKMEVPTTGEGGAMRGNVLSLSKMGRVTLTRGELANNVLTASKFSRVEVTDGKFVQCDVSGSSLTEIAVVGSVVRAVVFTGVKCSRLRLEGKSALDGCTVQASSIKGMTMVGGTVRGLAVTGSALSDVMLKQTTVMGGKWSDCRADGLMLENCEFENCQWVGCKLRGTRIVGVKLAGRVMRNLDLSGKTIEGEEAFGREVG